MAKAGTAEPDGGIGQYPPQFAGQMKRFPDEPFDRLAGQQGQTMMVAHDGGVQVGGQPQPSSGMPPRPYVELQYSGLVRATVAHAAFPSKMVSPRVREVSIANNVVTSSTGVRRGLSEVASAKVASPQPRLARAASRSRLNR